MLLGFIGRVILVRYTTQTEYGIYCMALVVISIFVTISTLGLTEMKAQRDTSHILEERMKKKFLSAKIKLVLGYK